MSAEATLRRIGEKCRSMRVERLKWTVYRAEKETGLQGSQIRAIEEASSDYTVKSLLRYCTALGVTVELKVRR